MLIPQIQVVLSDITELEVDCIVNAANEYLIRGGGVCGAIHSAAGPMLAAECKTIGGCSEGDAKITNGFNSKADFVIHTVGPQYFKSTNPEFLLKSCYRNSLLLAEHNEIKSIAFPCISTGVFGYPAEQAAKIAHQEVKNFSNYKNINKVIFCCYSKLDYEIYKELLAI